MPVYKVEFDRKPEFSKEPVQNGDILSLGVLWAGKVTEGNEDEKPEKLKYEKNTYIPDYGKNGLAVNKNCHAYFWDDSREIMCWDACFEKAGQYSATLVHAHLWAETRNNMCDFTLTVNGTTNAVNMQEEKSTYSISRTTNHFNTRICHDAGVFNIEKAGKYRILLKRSKKGESIPVTNIEFKKLPF